MATLDGSTSGWEGWITADDLEALALSLGVTKRRFDDWRERGLIPRPTRIGFDGKRPIWAYPPGAEERLRSAVRWRERTDDSHAITFGIWIDGNAVQPEQVRAAIADAVDRYESSMLRELEKGIHGSMTPQTLLDDPTLLQPAVEQLAERLAKRRGEQVPLKRQVDMSLPERIRGMQFVLNTLLGLPADPADALQMERILGISRGRSGTARGGIPWAPEETLPKTSLTPAALREAVQQADETVILAAGNGIRLLLQLLRFFYPLLIPDDSSMQRFAKDANALFDSAPPEFFAIFAAVLIASMHQQQLPIDQVQTHAQQLAPSAFAREILPQLEPDELKRLITAIRDHKNK